MSSESRGGGGGSFYAVLSSSDVKMNRIMHYARDQRRWKNASELNSRPLTIFWAANPEGFCARAYECFVPLRNIHHVQNVGDFHLLHGVITTNGLPDTTNGPQRRSASVV
jgi:hypothetical protein